jgi:sRNA-binding protein
MKRSVWILALILGVALVAGSALAQQPPETAVLKGNPMGAVKFPHATHAKLVADKCDTCHHASKPEKPLKAKQEKCQDCHTKTATPPMKTNARGAFHDAMAKQGTCITCHLKENAGGKKAPTKCTECHKKENG